MGNPCSLAPTVRPIDAKKELRDLINGLYTAQAREREHVDHERRGVLHALACLATMFDDWKELDDAEKAECVCGMHTILKHANRCEDWGLQQVEYLAALLRETV